jgi:hypothetical protein
MMPSGVAGRSARRHDLPALVQAVDRIVCRLSPRRCLGSALFRLEPSSGLIVLLLLPGVFLLLFLKGLSGSFRQSFTPAMACPPQRRSAHAPLRTNRVTISY